MVSTLVCFKIVRAMTSELCLQSAKRTVPSPNVERPPVFQPPVTIGIEEMNKCCPSLRVMSATQSNAYLNRTTPDGKQHNVVIHDTSITVDNTSTKAIAAIAFAARHRDRDERRLSKFFDREPILPGERVVRFSFGRDAEDGPIELKAIVFEDGTYEGDLRYVQGVLPILDGARSVHLSEIQELRELAKSSDADLSLRLIKAETRIWKSHDIAFAESEKTDPERANADAKCSVYKQYLDIVLKAWREASQEKTERARSILLQAADSMELRFSPAK